MDWVTFDGREVFRARKTSAENNWGLIRTFTFPHENWETASGIRVDIYQAGGAPGFDLKLEIYHPDRNVPMLQQIPCQNLPRNVLSTCTWDFDTASRDYSQISLTLYLVD